jgi:prophage regulatory protein
VRFIRTRQVLEMIGVSRTTLWRMVQAGTFPQPVRVTKRSRAFLLDAVEAWMKARTDASPTDPGVTAIGHERHPMRRAPASLFAGTARGAAG